MSLTDFHALYRTPGREVFGASDCLVCTDPHIVGLALREAGDCLCHSACARYAHGLVAGLEGLVHAVVDLVARRFRVLPPLDGHPLRGAIGHRADRGSCHAVGGHGLGWAIAGRCSRYDLVGILPTVGVGLGICVCDRGSGFYRGDLRATTIDEISCRTRHLLPSKLDTLSLVGCCQGCGCCRNDLDRYGL